MRLVGELHPNSKLTSNQIHTIRKLYKSGHSLSIIAKNFKVSQWNIKEIVNRKTWKHI